MLKQIILKEKKTLAKVSPELLNKIRLIMPLQLVFVMANLIACIQAESYFFVAGSACNLINILARTALLSNLTLNKRNKVNKRNKAIKRNKYNSSNKDKKSKEGKKGEEKNTVSEDKIYTGCIWGSFAVVITSFGFLGAGVLLFFFQDNLINGKKAVLIVILTGMNLLFTLYYHVIIHEYTGILFKFNRLLNYADALIVSALLISVTLIISENRMQLIGLTGIVLGGSAAGLAVYALWDILLTKEKNKKFYHHFRSNRTIIFTRLTLKKDIVVVLGKVILSCITLSGFMFANALYSAGMGIARYRAISAQNKEQKQRIHSYFEIGAAICGASLCYVVYSIKMFSNGSYIKFNMNIALIIAAYTFTEFYLIIKDYIKARKSKNLISEEIKLIGLSSTLICLVLTQAAILSISNENDNTFTNRQAGIIFGCISALVGVYMMIRSKYLKNSYGEEETRT